MSNLKPNVFNENVSSSTVFDVPEWIQSDLTLGDMRFICENGCSSGAYMPAVTYDNAMEVMDEYGDDILGYINDTLGYIPEPPVTVDIWAAVAVYYLSLAVEVWSGQVGCVEIE